jgi:hypothetical protein
MMFVDEARPYGVTGPGNQRLLLHCEYVAAENRIVRSHLPTRLRLSNPESSTLAEIGKPLGRKHLAQVACITKPDTLLAPYRQLIASKFDGSKCRSSPGRPGVDAGVAALIVRRPEFRFGGTIALSAHWPTSVTIYLASDGRQHPKAPWHRTDAATDFLRSRS